MVKKVKKNKQHEYPEYEHPQPIVPIIRSLPPLPSETQRKEKMRIGAHLVESILSAEEGTINLFESNKIPPFAQSLIIDRQKKLGINVDLSKTLTGVHIPQEHLSFFFTLLLLLHRRSQNTNPHAEDFYTGDTNPHAEDFYTPAVIPPSYPTDKGTLITLSPPILHINSYELAMAIYGESVGGKNIKQVEKSIKYFEHNPCFVTYTRQFRNPKGDIISLQVYAYDPLIKRIGLDFTNETTGEKRIVEALLLHPVFNDQIDTKFIVIACEVLESLKKYRIKIPSMLTLELAQAHSNRARHEKDEEGNTIYKIGKRKLFNKIARDYIDTRTQKLKRPARVKKYFEMAIDEMKAVGLLLQYNEYTNQNGEIVCKFVIPKTI